MAVGLMRLRVRWMHGGKGFYLSREGLACPFAGALRRACVGAELGASRVVPMDEARRDNPYYLGLREET
jgi:hypothetical protein